MASKIKKSNVAVCGVVGIPASYGGFETFVENLVKNGTDLNFYVYCERKYQKNKISLPNLNRLFIPLGANGPSSLLYDAVCILHATLIQKSDKIILLGCSGCWCLPFLSKTQRKKIIFHPDGIEYERPKFSKLGRAILKYLTLCGMRYSSSVIFDNPELKSKLEKLANVDKSHDIRYGGDHAATANLRTDYYLATCRIVPENNVELILRAFLNSKERLVFVGNWDATDFSRKLAIEFSNIPNIDIVSATYDPDELKHLRECAKGYIHGHSVGGTNPSLVEAIFYTDQIIAFDCKYNRATLHSAGAYFQNASELAAMLLDASGKLDKNIHEYLKAKYTWEQVTKDFVQICQQE